MLDSNFIRDHRTQVELAIKNKGVRVDLDEIFDLDGERRTLTARLDALNHARRMHAQQVQQAVTQGTAGAKPNAEIIATGKKLKEEIADVEKKLSQLEMQLRDRLLLVPNIYSEDTPVGMDDSFNKEILREGMLPQFDFPVKDHMDLARELDLIDTDRGAKVGGFRGYFLKNEAVELQWALLTYCLAVMRERGFTLMIPPTMVREMALIGSGHFPASKEEIYPVDENFLVGTSEPALLAYHADEILEEAQLPRKYCAVSPCYRREVGSYGKDTKGVYRVHEFWKVEQVVIAENNLINSLEHFEIMLGISADILKALKLPYRALQISTGDMGAGKYKMYDLETWMPGRNAYGETHSCSHLTDWQARRLNLRYRTKEGKIVFPHTLNNTVIASPRILIAILENYQQRDGTVSIPEVLRPLMGGRTVITKK